MISHKLGLKNGIKISDEYLNLHSIIKGEENYNMYFPLVFTFIYNMFDRINSTKICKGIESILFLNTIFFEENERNEDISKYVIFDFESIKHTAPTAPDTQIKMIDEYKLNKFTYKTKNIKCKQSRVEIRELEYQIEVSTDGSKNIRKKFCPGSNYRVIRFIYI